MRLAEILLVETGATPERMEDEVRKVREELAMREPTA